MQFTAKIKVRQISEHSMRVRFVIKTPGGEREEGERLIDFYHSDSAYMVRCAVSEIAEKIEEQIKNHYSE